MNCKSIKDKIDHWVFENDQQLMADISKHIENCEACRTYFSESLKAKIIIGLARKEPELDKPEDLSNSILNAIEDIKQIPEHNNNTKTPKIIRLISRTLAAASISLLMIFGVEQYMVIHKISKLENQVSQISNTPINDSFHNIVRYNSGITVKVLEKLLDKNNLGSINQSFKARLMLSRLSAFSINNIDKQKLNKYLEMTRETKK